MKKPAKLTKGEMRMKHLEGLLVRRTREIAAVRQRAEQEVKRLEGMNAMTQFEINSRKKGDWPGAN